MAQVTCSLGEEQYLAPGENIQPVHPNINIKGTQTHKSISIFVFHTYILYLTVLTFQRQDSTV